MSNAPSNSMFAVSGSLSGAINGVQIDGVVTGTADGRTGHVANVYHDIDPEIGPELSRMILAQTIICAGMAIQVEDARNLNTLIPMQKHQRVCTFTLPSHTMICKQSVEWVQPRAAVVTMDFSGDLPKFSGESTSITDVHSEFRQTGSNSILQTGKTEAMFDGGTQPLSVQIEYLIDGPPIASEKPFSQILENAKNSASYDRESKKILFNTDVRMLVG